MPFAILNRKYSKLPLCTGLNVILMITKYTKENIWIGEKDGEGRWATKFECFITNLLSKWLR